MNLRIIAGTLPTGYCYPANPQTLYNDMMDRAVAVQPLSLTGVLLQDTEPTVDERGYLWARTSGGAPVNPFLWKFHDGLWVAKHPSPPADQRREIYVGTVGSIDTLDGGVAGTVTDNTGPFWEIDTAFAFRMPVGVGTLPLAETVIGVNDTGGLDEVTLTAEQLPEAPVHPFGADGEATDALTVQQSSIEGDGVQQGRDLTSTASTGDKSDVTLKIAGSGEPHTNMPPYIGVFFLKRTARIYCTTPIS